MFNALWLNAQEFNGTGQLQKIVELGASVTAGATAASPLLVRRRGLKASVACGAAQTSGLFRRRTLRAAVSAGAVAPDDGAPMSPRRNMRAEAYVLTNSLLGASFTKYLAADVTCGATAVMYPYDALFEASVTAGATAAAPELVRIRQFGGAATVSATAAAAAPLVYRNAYSSVRAGARGVASPDTIVGGVRYAEFGTDVVVGADAECTIDPRKFLSGHGTVFSTAQATSAVNRYVMLRSNPQIAGATANFPPLRATVTVRGVPVQVGASASGALSRKANLRATPASAGARTNTNPRMRALRPLSAAANVSVMAAAPLLLHYRGLAANVTCGAPQAFASMTYAQKLYGFASVTVDATPPAIKLATKLAGEATCGISGLAEAEVKLAIKLAADVTAGATAEPASYFTIRELGGAGTISVQASNFMVRTRSLAAAVSAGAQVQATVWVNLYDWEPDFRTLDVEPEDWVDTIDAEDWTLTVTDDSQTMKTFTKQPAEILAYDLNFLPWFEQIPSDDIETASCIVTGGGTGSPSDLVVQQVVRIADDTGHAISPNSPAHRVKVWVAKGISGVTYKLTLTIDTEAGRRKEVDFKVKVKET